MHICVVFHPFYCFFFCIKSNSQCRYKNRELEQQQDWLHLWQEQETEKRKKREKAVHLFTVTGKKVLSFLLHSFIPDQLIYIFISYANPQTQTFRLRAATKKSLPRFTLMNAVGWRRGRRWWWSWSSNHRIDAVSSLWLLYAVNLAPFSFSGFFASQADLVN